MINTQTNATPTSRFVIKIAGESGQGVNSIGEILAKSFKEVGYYIFGYREYPSLIKGGYSMYQVDVADHAIGSAAAECDILVCFSRVSIHAYLSTLRSGGSLIHVLKAVKWSEEEEALIAAKNLKIEYVDGYALALQAGGKAIMMNTVMVGVLLKLLNLNKTVVSRVLQEEFAHKQEMLTSNIACLDVGYGYQLTTVQPPTLPSHQDTSLDNAYLMTGNHALALGAIAAGVRAYYAYPMTPSSSILSYLASWAKDTQMLVRQVEDEISAAQFAIGSMFMGTRALTGTSGGGFDLMTESVSMAAMTETPFVCILGQRPGPATGLPTWTATGDLNLAIYAGHGEYPRVVMAVSDVVSAYRMVAEAFNLAEKYQIPVILMTEKQVAESWFCVTELPTLAGIERGLVEQSKLVELKATDRFASSENGVSDRWTPGSSSVTYDANSDEHLSDGSLTEEAGPVKIMYDKRMKKAEFILQDLPEPVYYGSPDADLVLVGWGSVKNAVLDAQALLAQVGRQIGYLHYEYVYPLRTDKLRELIASKSDALVLIENNYLGQLGQLITQTTGFQFKKRVLKYDGRPFFVDDVLNYVQL
jgi:2-oxoglutarate/2-oxoacid ferredoxin oxidoreductase subunit alpha